MKRQLSRHTVYICSLFSLLLAVFAALGRKIVFGGQVWLGADRNYFLPFSALDIFYFLLFFCLLLLFLLLLTANTERIGKLFIASEGEGRRLSRGKFLVLATALLMLFYSPYLFSNYPGSLLGDSFGSISQIVSHRYNNTTPFLYTIFVGIFVGAGVAIGDMSLGIFMYTVVQYVLFCFALALILRKLYECRVRTVWLIASMLLFVLYDIYPKYAIAMWKDPLFSVALTVLSLLFAFDGVHSKKRSLAIAIVSLAALFIRNNGALVIVPLTLIAFLLRRRIGRLTGRLMALCLAVYLVVVGPVYSALNIHANPEEVVGIPLQQIAYTVVCEGDSLSEAQLEKVAQFISPERLELVYAPCLVDTVKWDEQFSYAGTREVASLWLELLCQHPAAYFKSYCLATFGYWHPYAQNAYGYTTFGVVDNDYSIVSRDLIQELTGSSLTPYLNDSFMIGTGSLAWLMLISLCICLCRREYRKLLLYIPSLLCWSTVLIWAPVAFSLRYVYILALFAPLFVFYPFSKEV